MKNKYDSLIEEIHMQEEIVEKKDNLAEQLSQITKDVDAVKDIVNQLVQTKDDLQGITNAVTAASKSTDNAVNAITQAILDSRKVIFICKLEDDSVRQLQKKYSDYSDKEAGLFKKHHEAIGKMFEQNKDKCYDIINKADGVYFGRKTFMRLYIVFCVCFGIIFMEIAYGVVKWLGI